MRHAWLSAAGVIGLAAGTAPAGAQAIDSVVVREAACAGCRLELGRVLELGDSAGGGRLDPALYSVARDSRGRILVASGLARPAALFAPDGRYLQALGERTAADSFPPAIRLVALGAGDTVHVVDDRNRRHHILSPALEPVRTATLSPFLRNSATGLVLPGGEMLMTGTVPTRENIGHPLHRVDSGGEIRLSFGSHTPEAMPGTEISRRRLASAGAGRVWSGHLTRYAVERWSLDGRHELTLVRDAPWFAPYAEMRRPSAGEPPQPLLLAVRQDSAGRLWTLARVADPRWAAAAPGSLAGLYDTVVEVFDPVCRRLLASRRLPELMVGFLDDKHIVEWRIEGASPPVLGVWRAEFSLPITEQPCTASSAGSRR